MPVLRAQCQFLADMKSPAFDDDPAMGFNKRKMGDRRREAAEQEAAARRATVRQILEDADHLITVWNERQAKRMPTLFSPTICRLKCICADRPRPSQILPANRRRCGMRLRYDRTMSRG